MRIYLIGFMGSGKTTIGRLLGDRLGVPFFDLDQLVEAAEGMSIKEIFAEKGEPYFRKREQDLLRTTHFLERAVVATGGGTFTFEENIAFIRTEGLSIYLAAPFSLLRQRIGDKAAERPLFRDSMAAHDLFQYRLKYYRLSDLTVELREPDSPVEVVERIVMMLPRDVIAAMPFDAGPR